MRALPSTLALQSSCLNGCLEHTQHIYEDHLNLSSRFHPSYFEIDVPCFEILRFEFEV